MTAYKQWQQQWRDTPRLRLGVVLITLILIGNGLLSLNDYRNHLIEDYDLQHAKLLKLHHIQQQTGWKEKAEQIKNLRMQYENSLWRAETRGLAQANVQTWLHEKLRQLQLTNLEVTGAKLQTQTAVPEVWQVVVEVKGTLYDSQLLDLLNQIEQNPKLMHIEQLQINRDLQDLLRINFQVSSYFQAVDKS